MTMLVMPDAHCNLYGIPQPCKAALATYTCKNNAQHGTARHGTAQHSTAQHSTAQHSTAQHKMQLQYIALAGTGT